MEEFEEDKDKKGERSKKNDETQWSNNNPQQILN